MVAESSACSGLKVGAQVFECCGYGLKDVIENGHRNSVFGSEVVHEIIWRNVGGGSDLVDGRRFVPERGTRLQSGVDEPFAVVLSS
jgi:hypothetical protein